MSFVSKEIAVFVGVNINDQIFFLVYKYHTTKDEEYICFFQLSFYVDNSQLSNGCLNRTCEEGDYLRQEILICPFLKV